MKINSLIHLVLVSVAGFGVFSGVLQASTAVAPVLPFSQQLDLTIANEAEGGWKFKEIKELPGVKLLTGGAESAPLPFTVTAPGEHRIWLKFYTEKDKAAAILAVIRAPNGEAVRAERVDAPFHRLSPAKPYLEQVIEREAGWQWVSFTVNFEYSGLYTLTLKGAVNRGGGSKLVGDIFVSNDPEFDPQVDPVVSTSTPAQQQDRISGFQLAKVHPLHTSLYSGIRDRKLQFETTLIQNGAIYLDPSAMVLMGVNHQQGAGGFGSEDFNRGILTVARGVRSEGNSSAFTKSTPTPEGRFVNAEGTVGRNFSLSYEPALEDAIKTGRETMLSMIDNSSIASWGVAGEGGGYLDYSRYSVEKFREWLQEKYGTIDKLNSAWRTSYKAFDEIAPAKSADDDKTNWLEFRDFSSKVFAQSIARSVEAVNEVDPQGRPATAQFSNLDFFASNFARRRPNNFEDLILIGLKDTDNVPWDGYCADDYMGAEVDLMHSLGRGKKMLVREWNTHHPDVAIAARTYWTMFGKGVKGISLFQFHEGAGHDSYPKWGLTNKDMSPRDKLGAFSDQMHEIHRLENVVVASKKTYPVKPVAIYYNKIDLTLSKAPLSSSWGEGIDTPYHVYEMLRGQGYAVSFITDLQIRDGLLSDVAAVVFVDAQHISAEACNRVSAWVEQGGVVIGDTWPGAYTELGHRQDTLIKLFGIDSRELKKVDQIKLDESSQGYGEVTISAINPDTLYNTVMETWQQWDSTHPVAKKLGNWMFSGYGATPIRCIAGEVVGMVFGGHPGVVINQTGKGHSLYVSTMLGSLYGGSCTRYEWDSTHSDLSPARLLDAFLEFADVKKQAVATLPERQAYKVRVETPLVDNRGNALITLVNYNDTVLPNFPLRVAWPKTLAAPHKLFAIHGGSREAVPVAFQLNDGQLSLEMPGFNSHAVLLALRESVPLLSLSFPEAVRGVADLVTLTPEQETVVEVTVHNASDRPISGQVTARLPEGWFYDHETVAIATIKPWGQATAKFRIRTPKNCAAKRVRPLSFIFESKDVQSMPTTEAVWWMNQ